MKRRLLFFVLVCFAYTGYGQVTIQSGATFFVQSGATVTIQGDLSSSSDIQGTGLILLKGPAAQTVNMNGFTVQPNLEIDNSNNITLTGAAITSGLLTFTNGKIILGANNFTQTAAATWAGAGTGKFIETNGTGIYTKQINANGTYTLPLGKGNDYMPLEYNLTGSTLSSASVSGRLINGGHPNKHPRSTDFLNQYWSLATSGVTGGTVTTTGTYVETGGLSGTESFLRGMSYSGGNWSMTGASQNNTSNTVSAPLTATSGDLYAMNRFVLANAKVFLQGAYTSGGLMNDLLRTNTAYSVGTVPPSNLIPTSDPYRVAPYTTNFSHVLNDVPETISNSVLADQPVAANNIVDWVFVQLRTISSPTVAPVVQTRSALLRRDGTIVDIDGQSPLYFKNADAGSYVISVRHRNHLGISMDPGAPVSLGLAAPAPFNFSTAADAAIFGTQGAAYTVSGGINLMWAGNVNGNVDSRYQGAQNDRGLILTDLGSNELTTLNGYLRADLNMNRSVRYQGAQNDRAYLLSSVLTNNELNIRQQALPN